MIIIICMYYIMMTLSRWIIAQDLLEGQHCTCQPGRDGTRCCNDNYDDFDHYYDNVAHHQYLEVITNASGGVGPLGGGRKCSSSSGSRLDSSSLCCKVLVVIIIVIIINIIIIIIIIIMPMSFL